LHQPACGAGRHEARLSSGEIVAREVPAIVAPETQQRALAQLAENKRYSGGRNRRDYLLRGLVRCGTCGSACVGHSTTARDAKRHYYVCANDRASSSRPRRGPKGHAPFVNAEALEEMVWDDVHRFLENPGEVLEQVREQMESDDATAELEARHADLTDRLAAKSAEKDRYVRAFAQGHISEEELAEYVTDIKNQIDNLKLLISSVEDELEAQRESREIAESVAAWLLTLRERIHEVEGDTPEAYRKRRELVKLLVEQIITSRDADGRTKIEVRYRFGPPEGPDEHVSREQNAWENMAATVARVYDSLPAEDRSRACVFTANYGEAGAIDFFGERYGLPRAISGHNSCYVWGPGGCAGEVVISVGVPRGDLEAIFGEVNQEATIRCEYCMPDEDNLPVYVCRNPRAPLGELWPQVKHYD
jgi:hypothetical protein